MLKLLFLAFLGFVMYWHFLSGCFRRLFQPCFGHVNAGRWPAAFQATIPTRQALDGTSFGRRKGWPVCPADGRLTPSSPAWEPGP
jgi:hypothetical protein